MTSILNRLASRIARDTIEKSCVEFKGRRVNVSVSFVPYSSTLILGMKLIEVTEIAEEQLRVTVTPQVKTGKMIKKIAKDGADAIIEKMKKSLDKLGKNYTV